MNASMTEQAVVLLTGASSGIGLALTKLLYNNPNYKLVATAREASLARLKEAGLADNENFLTLPLDVDLANQREAVVKQILNRFGRIDILINNAGISYRSVLEHMSEADEHQQMESNFFSPLALIRLVLPGMRDRRHGHIINVSSVGGMMAMPTMGSYSASKFALEGASEALWYEMKPWNIKVSLVQPGFVHSNSFRRVRFSKLATGALQSNDPYRVYYDSMGSFVETIMGLAVATSESIAVKIVRTMEQPNPPLRVPATIDAYFFSILRRFLPRRLYHWVLFHNLPQIKKWGRRN